MHYKKRIRLKHKNNRKKYHQIKSSYFYEIKRYGLQNLFKHIFMRSHVTFTVPVFYVMVIIQY
jgi:hypothetical protein